MIITATITTIIVVSRISRYKYHFFYIFISIVVIMRIIEEILKVVIKIRVLLLVIMMMIIIKVLLVMKKAMLIYILPHQNDILLYIKALSNYNVNDTVIITTVINDN